MFNKILPLQKPRRLTCVWILTGYTRMPLVCVWVNDGAQVNVKASSCSNDESREMRLCA
jgi:hypothetical protein